MIFFESNFFINTSEMLWSIIIFNAMLVQESIFNISKRFSGILLDAYGVFWGGNAIGLFPGVQDAMKLLVKEGKIVGILSNTTQLGYLEIKKLAKRGITQGQHFHFLLTSGDIAKRIFNDQTLPFDTPRKKYWLFGAAHSQYASPYALFEESAYQETPYLEEADFIYISIPYLNGLDQTDPHVFQELVQKLAVAKIPMVCANPDRFAYEGNPARAVVRQGSIASLYEQMGGSVFYIGKPSRIAYSNAMHQFELLGLKGKDNILMVGDTPETDIKGAREFGMASALVIETGVLQGRLAEQPALRLGPLETPDYYIKKLAPDGFIRTTS